jgi:acetyl esterase
MTQASGPASPPVRRRQHLDIAAALAGAPYLPNVTTREVAIPTGDHELAARLFTPHDLGTGSPLLVYQHGGGWVTGSLDSHEAVCRYLAVHAGVRVLSIGYRLAPEDPFPAAVEDSLTAFRFALRHAHELGADPAAVAMGGDSSGANLALVTSHCAVRSGERSPVFLLLFYPPTDAVHRTRSRELFGAGFLLTDADIDWFADHYMPAPIDRGDPRASILLADDLSGMPPTYLVTAGFDPLRDEGEAFAGRLADFGVPIVLRRQPDLVHGFVNLIGLLPRCREAVADAAGALRSGLAFAARPSTTRPDK